MNLQYYFNYVTIVEEGSLTAASRKLHIAQPALSNQISSLTRTERQATARIAANPTQAKYLLSVERQQSVKEALYLYLLQKREENELSQAFTAYNTRIIDPPTGSMSPTAPRKSMIYLLALLLGLCIPLAALYLMEVLNSRR